MNLASTVKITVDGKSKVWNAETINIKREFGEFACLYDKAGNQIPLKSSGEPLVPLDPRMKYQVKLQSSGDKVEELVQQSKMKYMRQAMELRQQKSKEKTLELQNLNLASLASNQANTSSEHSPSFRNPNEESVPFLSNSYSGKKNSKLPSGKLFIAINEKMMRFHAGVYYLQHYAN